MELTSQQERFAQEISNGKNQSEAYRIAYPKSLKWKDKTVWEKASKIAKDDKVRTRIVELKANLEKKELWTREQSVMALKNALEIADRPTDVVAVIKELNNMHGYNESNINLGNKDNKPLKVAILGYKPDE